MASINPLTSKLITAIMAGNISAVKKLLKANVDPNGCEDEANMTPLHVAALHQQYECAQLLVNYGADPTIKTIDGAKPLDYAMHNISDRLLQLLKDSEQKKKKSR